MLACKTQVEARCDGIAFLVSPPIHEKWAIRRRLCIPVGLVIITHAQMPAANGNIQLVFQLRGASRTPRNVVYRVMDGLMDGWMGQWVNW